MTTAQQSPEPDAHEQRAPCVLTLNCGSSTVRFALYELSSALNLLLHGKVERIGLRDGQMRIEDMHGAVLEQCTLDATDHGTAANHLLSWLESQSVFTRIQAVGHRVVFGMTHTTPQRVTTTLLNELHQVMQFDPEHLPQELALIETVAARFPALPQIACFDTAFHRNMPTVAKLLPIPRRYQTAGIERYGFHGLSYTYLLEELARLNDPAATRGRVILAHLGNGASLAAVRDGKGIDTSMGFTPTSGLMMSTRTGDLDPGLIYYLTQTQQLSAKQVQHMVNHESGLLGVSEISGDLRDLLARETSDRRAADAVSLFCYQTRKWIGSLAAALGGLDTLVFSGGIGENAALIRQRICSDLGFLGIQLDESRNTSNAPVISTAGSNVTVRVLRTNEELMIARMVSRLMGWSSAERETAP